MGICGGYDFKALLGLAATIGSSAELNDDITFFSSLAVLKAAA
jgi:hypothetical protein